MIDDTVPQPVRNNVVARIIGATARTLRGATIPFHSNLAQGDEVLFKESAQITPLTQS